MAKLLVLYAHTDANYAQHTKYLYSQLQTFPNTTALWLPTDQAFDVSKHQTLINEHDHILFLFPINWYNIPWTLSRYLSEVWTMNLSLKNKTVHYMTTAGSSEHFYTRSSSNNASGLELNDFLANLRFTISALGGSLGGNYHYFDATELQQDRLEAFNAKVLADLKKRINEC